MKEDRMPKEGLQPLSSAVMTRALAEAEQVLAEASRKAERVLAEPHERARVAREAILGPAEQEARQIRQRTAAEAQLEAQNLTLKRREELLNAVFSAAREGIVAVRQRDEYPAIVRQLTLEALRGLHVKEGRILADAEAHALLAGGLLKEAAESAGVDLQLGPVLEDRTGVVVETVDGHRLYDNTLEARLERQRDALRASVYRMLTGEDG
jgi:vacuolar-type H+-ATPase subunit E/Vma4